MIGMVCSMTVQAHSAKPDGCSVVEFDLVIAIQRSEYSNCLYHGK